MKVNKSDNGKTFYFEKEEHEIQKELEVTDLYRRITELEKAMVKLDPGYKVPVKPDKLKERQE